MSYPLFFCTGVVRSGSTWSFNVVRMLSEYWGRKAGRPMGSAYLEGANLEQFLTRNLPQAAGVTVIKAHGIGPTAISMLQSGRARAVCTIRDPRDCVASDLTFLHKDINFSIKRVVDNLHYISMYEGGHHTLFVQYEQMMANPLKQVARIAAHLGIDADESVLRQIDVATSIPSSLAAIEVLKKKDPKQVMWLDNHRVDPGNHLHENHIHSGKVGRWRDEFSADQAKRLTSIFKPWLLKFGYELDDIGSREMAAG
jgi:hypothetical protein